jgi:hypothetical protein
MDESVRHARRCRFLSPLRKAKSLDDALPLDSGILEIDQETQAQVAGPQIVEALRGVLTRETIHTLQLDHQFILHEDVGKVLSDRVALIGDSQHRSVRESKYPCSSVANSVVLP